MARALVVYGPNLNLLGEREPDVYGHETLEDISARLRETASREGVSVEVLQSNSEGAIIDRLQVARDAIAAIRIPVIEGHVTNLPAREPFRPSSVLAPACTGVVHGFGVNSFLLGLRAAIDLVRR